VQPAGVTGPLGATLGLVVGAGAGLSVALQPPSTNAPIRTAIAATRTLT
jgi:hypothetical protein